MRSDTCRWPRWAPSFCLRSWPNVAERAAVVLTTNLPFSEWTQVIPNARLCKALLDRLTDRAHIIETGTESFRSRRTLEQRQRRGARPKRKSRSAGGWATPENRTGPFPVDEHTAPPGGDTP